MWSHLTSPRFYLNYIPIGFPPLARLGAVLYNLPNLPLESLTPFWAPAPGPGLGPEGRGLISPPRPPLHLPLGPQPGFSSSATASKGLMEFPLRLSGSRSRLSSCLQPLLERGIRPGSLEGLWSQTLQTQTGGAGRGPCLTFLFAEAPTLLTCPQPTSPCSSLGFPAPIL